MTNIFKDIIAFFKSLSFVDVVFMMSIIGLIVLIVTLIYIIKVNDEEETEEQVKENEKEDLIEEIKEDKKDEVVEEELDLSKITQELDKSNPKVIALNDYEKEQEEKAIISYDELLKTKDLQEEINYIKEQNVGDLTIKSVDVESVTRPIELPKIKEKIAEQKEEKKTNVEEIKEQLEELDTAPRHSKTILISYKKEEEFLQTLKSLDNLLN